MIRKIGKFFLDMTETVTTSLAVFMLLYLFVGQHSQVKGMSMYPTLHDQDSLIISKISYELGGNPQRGDIVVFKAPPDPNEEFIKRVTGVPGDSLEIRQGGVYINGSLEPESFLPVGVTTRPGKFLSEDKELAIPEAFYFVMGDNRSASSDSRDWGLVPQKNIVGKAVFRFWPLDEFGQVE
jgi:signal peptidase I